MLTNIDIEDIANKDDLDLIGVYSKDTLPNERMVGSYVINLQNYNDGNGTHWVAFKIFPNKKCCYFDSYGLGMPVEVSNFLEPFKPVATNNRPIQDIKSIKCGYFCLAFIKFFNDINYKKEDVYEEFDNWLNSFSNNAKLNDKIVNEMIKKY